MLPTLAQYRAFRAACSMALALVPVHPAWAGVNSCASNVQYPPYFHFSGESGHGGLSLQILEKSLGGFSGKFSVQVLPWKRCLKLAELGMMDIVINVPTAQIDPEPFLVSESYAELHSAYYVSRKHRPNGIGIASLEDLKSYRLCGLAGNLYDSYGLKNHPVDSGATNYYALVGKLHSGSCDIFLEKQEVVAGLSDIDQELGKLFASEHLIGRTLPEDSPIGLHFAISKKSAQADAIIRAVNRFILGSRAEAAKTTKKRRRLPAPPPASP